jgi:F-type H+-transporting ATPase subunit delta
MPKLSRRRIAREIVQLIARNPERQSEILRQTAAYLLQHKKAGEVHLLMLDIADELQKTQGLMTAEVQSAFGLASTTRDQIVAMLKNVTGAQNVELSETVQPELIGGVVIRTPQFELDASVKRQLNQLAGGIN